jgi:DNA-directed RNA polymerase specialized sigma24 family protein
MPEPDRAALRQQDADFAERLRRRDRTVLAEIDHHYGPSLRKRLQSDSCMDEVAIEQVLDAVLQAVWDNYNGESPVFAFYHRVGGRRRADRIEQWKRARKVERAASWSAGIADPAARERPPDHRIQNDELRAALENAERTLTSRQFKAYRARFAPDRQPLWDQRLADEAGGTAQGWRKASDEAVEKMQASLNEQGFGLERAGVKKYVTAAKTTA